MSERVIASDWKQWLIILVIVMAPSSVAGQNGLEAKLDQSVDFTPVRGTVREQLVQVAQHYKIPMGIEWVLQSEQKKVKPVAGQSLTVMVLLNSILQAAPEYSLNVTNGVVSVIHSRYARDSRNFLNLRIGEFTLSNANVFDASAELRLMIRATLHPELFVGGSNGGYGYGIPDENGLDIKNISFSGKDLSVRDKLNRIVSSNGNTLWLVNIAPARMMKDEPFFAQFDADQERNFSWTIIPFNKSTPK